MSHSSQPAPATTRSAEYPDSNRRFSPLRMFLITIVGIFAAEVTAMAAVYFLPPLPYEVTAVIDAGIMVVLIFPILYFLSLKPVIRYVEKLQAAERSLHQNEELQLRFFNSIDVMIAYMDRDFNFIKVNDAYAGSAEGRGPEYFEGKNHFALYPHAENQVIFQKVVDTGAAYIALEKPFEYPDQPERGVTYWDWSLQPVRGLDGSVEGVVLSLLDVTERKRAELALEERNLKLQALSESERRQRQAAEILRAAAQDLTRSLELDVVLRTLMDHMRALMHSDTASVLFPEGETRLGVRASEGYEQWTDQNMILATKVESESNPFFEKLITARKSLLIPDIAAEPDWVAYPGTEPIQSRLFVPIAVEDKLVCIVSLGKFETGYFTEEHTRWAEALVGQAAVAIQNAWLFEQVRAGSERLHIISRRLVEIQEKERLYIARELHDQASQTLTSLILGLGMLEKEPETPPSIQARIAGLKGMTDLVLEELHRLAINLRPASLDHLGLTPALVQFINSFTHDTHLPIRFKTVGFSEDERLPQDVETTLYRIVQEALTNVVRHAKATRADVVLERRGNCMLVIVEDDGVGFDPGKTRETGHLGLMGMQERAEMLGGTLTIESLPGKGTTLFAEVPYGNTNLARG